MALLLLFNVHNPEKRTAIRLTSMKLGLTVRDVPPEMQGLTIEQLLQGPSSAPKEGDPRTAEKPFEEELLLMHDVPSEKFHALLDTLRREGQGIRLKAIVTEHNRSWTARRLYRELSAEAAAMERIGQRKTSAKHRKKS